jgi:hypothetical protein
MVEQNGTEKLLRMVEGGQIKGFDVRNKPGNALVLRTMGIRRANRRMSGGTSMLFYLEPRCFRM